MSIRQYLEGCPECGCLEHKEEQEENVSGTYSVVYFTATDYHDIYRVKSCSRCGNHYDQQLIDSWTEEYMC